MDKATKYWQDVDRRMKYFYSMCKEVKPNCTQEEERKAWNFIVIDQYVNVDMRREGLMKLEVPDLISLLINKGYAECRKVK